MTSNSETVCHQMPEAGNIAKTMTTNRKQFNVTCEMLTVVAYDQSMQLKVALMLSLEFQCVLTNHSMNGPLGNSDFFPSILNVS